MLSNFYAVIFNPLKAPLPNILLYLADVFCRDKLYIQTHIHKPLADGYFSLRVFLQAQGTGDHFSCIGSLVYQFISISYNFNGR